MKKKKFVDTLGTVETDNKANKKIPWYERFSDKNVAQLGKKIIGKITPARKTTFAHGSKNQDDITNTITSTSSSISPFLTPQQKKYSTLSPVEFGMILRKKRKEKLWNYGDISNELKFRESFIEALEDGRYYLLPDHYFIRGFINQYAELLEIHEDIYLAYLAEHFHDEVAIKRLLKINNITNVSLTDIKGKAGYVKKKSNLNPIHLTDLLKPISVIATVGLLFAGYYLFLSIGQKNNFADDTASLNSTPELVLQAKNDVWIQLTNASGQILLETEINKGKTITLPKEKNLKLSTPTVANLLFLLDDKTYRYNQINNSYLQNLNLDIQNLLPLLVIAPSAIIEPVAPIIKKEPEKKPAPANEPTAPDNIITTRNPKDI
ncbi:MAG: RodZ domain-containing protein [Alphaproteobacteria bacterium]